MTHYFICELTPTSLHILRKGQGLSYVELGKLAGVSKDYIESFENGRRTSIGIKTARKIGEALGAKFILT
jgi:transcriptional regulator with XRE-family HTH domain